MIRERKSQVNPKDHVSTCMGSLSFISGAAPLALMRGLFPLCCELRCSLPPLNPSALPSDPSHCGWVIPAPGPSTLTCTLASGSSLSWALSSDSSPSWLLLPCTTGCPAGQTQFHKHLLYHMLSQLWSLLEGVEISGEENLVGCLLQAMTHQCSRLFFSFWFTSLPSSSLILYSPKRYLLQCVWDFPCAQVSWNMYNVVFSVCISILY